jgi:hypothetical protein
MVEKLSDFGVKDVRFRLGRIAHRKDVKRREHEKDEISHEDSLFVSELTSRIGDEKLKATLVRVLEKSLRSTRRSKSD